MTNPESHSEDGERYTCSQNAHFMGEELSGLLFYSTFECSEHIAQSKSSISAYAFILFYSLFFSDLPEPESFLS